MAIQILWESKYHPGFSFFFFFFCYCRRRTRVISFLDVQIKYRCHLLCIYGDLYFFPPLQFEMFIWSAYNAESFAIAIIFFFFLFSTANLHWLTQVVEFSAFFKLDECGLIRTHWKMSSLGFCWLLFRDLVTIAYLTCARNSWRLIWKLFSNLVKQFWLRVQFTL